MTDPAPRTPRRVADAYVAALVRIDPLLATSLGLPDGAGELPDLSPAGAAARADLARATLAELAALPPLPAGPPPGAGPAGAAPGAAPGAGPAAAAPVAGPGADLTAASERRCARLLTERLEAALALDAAGEHLREVGTLFAPVQSIRQAFTLMPTATPEQWTAVADRLHAVPQAVEGYRESLAAGLAAGLPGGPRQVEGMVEQFGQWLAADWFGGFVAGQEDPRLADGAGVATAAVAGLRDWLRDEYAPGVTAAGGRDPVGAERYRTFARGWNGADLDLHEAYAWAWQEYGRLDAELRAQAELVLPGATPAQAMAHLDEHGPAIEGVEEVRAHLQGMMDDAIRAVDGIHVDLAPPVRAVEAMIAPAGSAAAPFYTPPAVDFSRPGRTWLPTQGQTRFPLWNLVSTWYHEGVPGHHLQLGQWTYLAGELSRYQTTVGAVSANLEGWALYAERLMDELGFLTDPGARIGYLDAQQLRAVRVIIDIGMHLELELPADQGGASPFAVGERWTPALAREFFGRNSGRPAEFLDSELVRYLGMPGQAIGYKLGERAWLEGRERARAARGAGFDLRAWHTAALATGSLGLDDLVEELAAL